MNMNRYKHLIALALLAVAFTVTAEPRRLNKPVVCEDTQLVLRSMIEEFKETPQWQGYNPQQGTSVVLTVNLKTGAWTLIEYTAVTACIIAVGENSSSSWGTPI